jgi:magnesium transporter
MKIISEGKRELLELRKWINPMKEAIAKVNRAECNMIQRSTLPYYGDLQDHINGVIENIDLQRALYEDLRETYNSNMTLRMNRVMEVLTIVTTIFIPLSFVAGVYGMNFKIMPELDWKHGYFMALGFMLLVALLMLHWFKRKNWI